MCICNVFMLLFDNNSTVFILILFNKLIKFVILFFHDLFDFISYFLSSLIFPALISTCTGLNGRHGSLLC